MGSMAYVYGTVMTLVPLLVSNLVSYLVITTGMVLVMTVSVGTSLVEDPVMVLVTCLVHSFSLVMTVGTYAVELMTSSL